MTGTRIIKKIACVVLSILLFISISNAHSYSYAANSSENYELNTEALTDDGFTNNSTKANEAYALLIQSFLDSEENVYTEAYGEYTVSGIYGAGFPEYYCGAYINTDGNLVVKIKSNIEDAAKIEAKQDILNIVNGYKPIFRSSDISYRDLVLTMSELTELRQETTDPEIEYVCSYSLDEYNGQVHIGIYNESEIVRRKVLDYLTYPEIVTIEVVEKPQPCIASGAYGKPIGETYSLNNNYFSIGYRASYNNSGSTVYGFVTCGHGFLGSSSTNAYYAPDVYGINNNTPIVGSLIGTIDSSRYVCTFGANIDAAFIQLSSGSTVSNQIVTRYGGTYSISTSSPADPAMGSTVYSYGASSDDQYGYLQSGYVVSSSNTFYCSSFSVLDTLLTTCTIIPGDSGGPMVYSTSGGTYRVGGINTGYYTVGLVQYGYHTKGSNITTQFGLSSY